MSDLISRNALLEFAHNHVGGTVDCNDIARVPSVDVVPMDFHERCLGLEVKKRIAAEKTARQCIENYAPVRHGRWGFLGMDMMAGSRAFYFGTCSECRERINFEPKHKNYCPNCGAKMDGETNG